MHTSYTTITVKNIFNENFTLYLHIILKMYFDVILTDCLRYKNERK